jgi:hypothetical protein
MFLAVRDGCPSSFCLISICQALTTACISAQKAKSTPILPAGARVERRFTSQYASLPRSKFPAGSERIPRKGQIQMLSFDRVGISFASSID